MQFALLIYESPEAFASRKKDEIGAFNGCMALVLQGSRRRWRLRRL